MRSRTSFRSKLASVVILGLTLAGCHDAPTQPTALRPPDLPSFHAATTEDGRTKINFISPADFRLVGDAAIVTTGGQQAIRLTRAAANLRGAAWLTTKKFLANGFEAEFHFRMVPGNCFDTADGLAFVLHNDSRGSGAIGATGGSMGYQGIARGLAVEFDTYDNDDVPDPNNNHVAVMSNGANALSIDHSIAQLGLASPPQRLENGTRYRVVVDYRPGTLNVLFADAPTPLISTATTLTSVKGATLLDANGMAWVGFTAATGGACEAHFIDILPNDVPVAHAGGPYAPDEGSPVTLSASQSQDPDGDPLTFAWDTDGDGAFDDGAAESVEATFGDNGTYTVRVRVTDHHNASSVAEAQVTVANVAPTATISVTSPVTEGSEFTVSLTDAVDPSASDVAAGLAYALDCGSGYGPFATSASQTCSTADDETRTVRGKIRDKDAGETEYTAVVIVANVAPTLSALSGPSDPQAVGSSVSVNATYTDVGPLDTHAASADWGDGTTSAGTAAGGTASASYVYSTPGVYTVRMTVTDDDGGVSNESVFQYVVVYDPSGAFVTGGGWIMSPEGAYGGDPTLTGKATFGFVAKYQKGASTPSGNAEFQFKAGSLNFKSTSYEWLVVAGAKAQFKGEGTIGGAGRYGFMLTAIDGDLKGTGGDALRIKIWDLAGGSIVYDNKLGEGDDSDAATALGGGSIVIHK